MRNQMAIIKNVTNLLDAYAALSARDNGIPGIGLLHGETGAGKSTAIAWLVTRNNVNGIYVRANATWTPSSMLAAILGELGNSPIHNRSAEMVNLITDQLSLTGRPLFVDEADYLLHNPKMLETLRDIHDISSSPVVLIGMAGIEKRIVHRLQLARRISQWVEFLPTDLADARTLTDKVCEVQVQDDLLKRLHDEAKGSVGLMVVGLSRIEAFARGSDLTTIGLQQWGNRQLFLSRKSIR